MDQVDLPNEYALISTHGAVMIFAWVFASSVGIFSARHLKKWTSHLFEMEQWFLWHRVFMALTWTFTMASFILIFIDLDGWSTSAHAILGLVTTIICFFHPILAMLRPLKDDVKRRKYFNWGHMIGGMTAHILAILTIYTATRLEQLKFLNDAFVWILIAFLIFHILSHIVIAKINEVDFHKTISVRVFIIYGICVLGFAVALMTLAVISVSEYQDALLEVVP